MLQKYAHNTECTLRKQTVYRHRLTDLLNCADVTRQLFQNAEVMKNTDTGR